MSKDSIVTQFVQGLKSRNQQNKAAQELLLYVKTELREMPPEEQVAFLDEFNHHIFDMISSTDINEKKGGVLAISNNHLMERFCYSQY
jgi:serine/threonine-protein kinase mTOR